MRMLPLFLSLLAVRSLAPAQASADASNAPVSGQNILTILTDRPGPQISRKLYGIFFEEINHAGDGGLYAESIRNRNFQESDMAGRPAGWSLLGTDKRRATMRLDPDRSLNSALPKALRIDIGSSGSGSVSLMNDGYWGIALRAGTAYRFVMYARASADFRGPVRVTLEDPSGRIYARHTIASLRDHWGRIEFALRPTADTPHGRLVISFDAPGSVWIGFVSLFPKVTWKGRENGLRFDLAERISSLHPKFLRFPGGCFVDGGERVGDAFHWQKAIGDVAGRPGHPDAVWGYRSSDGLGLHEYLQWAEDLGAEPVFVVNCGMSDKEVVPMSEIDPWLQEALDAIEYARGPASSRWGALRAKAGHTEPFRLHFIEIGNENGGGEGNGGTPEQYAERYRRFHDAIKARYPDIQVIATSAIAEPADLLDEHHYENPDWFWTNAHRYDHADRRGTKIFVGEYAVNKDCGRGNLRAALAEAAFMTGLERNSDVVEMASYAPLLENDHDRKWNPDAIVFDNTRSYGTPSYFVQRLFSENTGGRLLPLRLPRLPRFEGVAELENLSDEIILKIVNGSEIARHVEIDLPGSMNVRKDVRSVVLTSDSLDAENSLDRPQRVAPKIELWGALSFPLRYTFPARSVTVLRLRPEAI